MKKILSIFALTLAFLPFAAFAYTGTSFNFVRGGGLDSSDWIECQGVTACENFFAGLAPGVGIDVSGSTSNDGSYTNPSNSWNGAEYRIYPKGTLTNENDGATVTIVAHTSSHTITATGGAHGTVDPSGSVSVSDGQDQPFAFCPATGYTVATITVDGSSVGGGTKTSSLVCTGGFTWNYTIANVTADHTITATYAVPPTPPAHYNALLGTASTTGMVGNVVHAVGANIVPIGTVLGLSAAPPILFFAARAFIALFLL